MRIIIFKECKNKDAENNDKDTNRETEMFYEQLYGEQINYTIRVWNTCRHVISDAVQKEIEAKQTPPSSFICW
jgi:hypothetical protein